MVCFMGSGNATAVPRQSHCVCSHLQRGSHAAWGVCPHCALQRRVMLDLSMGLQAPAAGCMPPGTV